MSLFVFLLFRACHGSGDGHLLGHSGFMLRNLEPHRYPYDPRSIMPRRCRPRYAGNLDDSLVWPAVA